MALDTIALRQSFELVATRAPNLTGRFYEILFERYPQTRPMFGRSGKSMAMQEQMLTRALVAVLDRLEDGTWLVDTLKGLGAKHVDYHVTDDMYAWVGDALLRTLAEVAGDDWSPRVSEAWKEAYSAISGLMIEGAREARAARPKPLSPVAASLGPVPDSANKPSSQRTTLTPPPSAPA